MCMTSQKLPAAPDRAAFDEAIGRSAPVWYSACLRITGEPSLAEDAVQDALLNAWGKRDQFKADARLDTWIHRIAVNSALGLLRRARLRVWSPLDERLPDQDPGPAQQCAEGHLARELDVALEALSEMERVCFTLKHLEQYRLKEIAERLQTEVGPVKQALFRALGKLRINMTVVKDT